MNDDLFANIPPMLSPRLKWMRKHGITTDSKATSEGPAWRAYMGDVVAGGITEDDALFNLAKKAQIRTWNEPT